MERVLFWIYLFNAILLIIHEIDSGYWKEWELFRSPGGLPGFLWAHVPLLFVVLYGLVLVDRGDPAGRIFSAITAIGGMLAFGIHRVFLIKGGNEFNTTTSKVVLWGALILSVIQICLTFWGAARNNHGTTASR